MWHCLPWTLSKFRRISAVWPSAQSARARQPWPGYLVRTIISTVHRDFQACLTPENFLVRELKTVETDTGEQRYIYTAGCEQPWVLCYMPEGYGEKSCGLNSSWLDYIPGKYCCPNWTIRERILRWKWNPCLGSVWQSVLQIRAIRWHIVPPVQTKGQVPLSGKNCCLSTGPFKKARENTAKFLTWKMSTCVVIPPLPRYWMLFASWSLFRCWY